MKITVLGLWHLGCVTAACCARHFDVTGLEFDPTNLANLKEGKAPLLEPGLDDLLGAGLNSGKLTFTNDINGGCRDADILWVTYDTPVDDNDLADVEFVLREVRRCIPALPKGALILLSSQLPVGTCRLLEGEFGVQGFRFASSPENLRLGRALDAFARADRVIVGCRNERAHAQLAELFAPFTRNIVWMRPESAEMTKHAINAFLAVSITFMNEVACLCEDTGADAKEVERGLKTESRIGPQAYLTPGGPFAGGTLARDVVTLTNLAGSFGEPLEVLPAIKRSNDRHRQWTWQTIKKRFTGEPKRCVALLGLTYKPGTNTLRRSSAVELARALTQDGFDVRAFDPSQPLLPSELSFIQLKSTVEEVLQGADAIVVCTEWPEFRTLNWRNILDPARPVLVVDAARFLEKSLGALPQVQYVAVGSSI